MPSLHSTSPQALFEDFSLFKTMFPEYFYLSKEKYLHIWQNFSGRLIKLHSKSSEQFAVNHKFPILFPNSSITFDCSVELFTPFDKSIRFDRPKRLYVSRGLLCRKTCLCEKEIFFFLSFLNLERNISNFYLEQFSEELSILLSRFSEERFYKKFFLKKYQVSFLYLAKMRENFIFERNFYESFATTVVARWKFSVTFFPDEGQILSHLWTLNKKSEFWPMFFRQVCQNCSLLVRMNCLTNFVSWIFFLFWSLTKSVQPCGAFFASLVEAAFRRQKGTFEEKIVFFLKLVFFCRFREFSEKFWVFCH